jgi:hypothetical protein
MLSLSLCLSVGLSVCLSLSLSLSFSLSLSLSLSLSSNLFTLHSSFLALARRPRRRHSMWFAWRYPGEQQLPLLLNTGLGVSAIPFTSEHGTQISQAVSVFQEAA